MNYKRILLKLSGEGLSSPNGSLAIDPIVVDNIAYQVKKIMQQGIEVGIVVGGGNFWRGASATKNGIERNKADYIGMLATIMNSLALQSSFEHIDLPTKVLSAISMEDRVVESFSIERANNYLKSKNVVIFAGGTGRPFFTTDTTATLVAAEIKADVILMAKNGVDGVYEKDPRVNKNAKHYDKLSYDELIQKRLQVIDLTASSMARENNIDCLVFNIAEKDAIIKVLQSKVKHTLISEK